MLMLFAGRRTFGQLAACISNARLICTALINAELVVAMMFVRGVGVMRDAVPMCDDVTMCKGVIIRDSRLRVPMMPAATKHGMQQHGEDNRYDGDMSHGKLSNSVTERPYHER